MEKIIMLKLIGAASGGLLVGSGVTYLVVKGRLEAKFQKAAEEEIEAIRNVYRAVNEDSMTGEEYVRTVLEAQKAAEEVVVISERLDGTPIVAQEPEQTEEQILEWKERLQDYQGTLSEPEFARVSYEKPGNPQEKADAFFLNRDKTQPYLISVGEYMEQDTGRPMDHYTKAMLTFYEGDGVLVDERDIPIEDITFLIGDEALTQFGNHSDDSDIVYVRREASETDFEISRTPRSFSDQYNLPSDEKEPIRKMRDDE